MKKTYEIGRTALRRDGSQDPFYIIKATSGLGEVKFYEGRSYLYEKLKEKGRKTSYCTLINGSVVEESPIYKSGDELRFLPRITQFVRGMKIEHTYAAITNNDLYDYTKFAPNDFHEFMKILGTGSNILNVDSGDIFDTSESKNDILVGVQVRDKYKGMKDEDFEPDVCQNIKEYMCPDGVCYFLLTDTCGMRVPFVLKPFNIMA